LASSPPLQEGREGTSSEPSQPLTLDSTPPPLTTITVMLLTTKRRSCGSVGQSTASNSGRPRSIPGEFTWDLWWTKWHWDRFCLPVLRFPLSSLYEWSVFFFILVLLLSEGQAGAEY
jgi:hypothetical protein